MRKLLLMIAAVVAVAQPTYDSTFVEAAKFDQHWISYLRQLAGCPKTGDIDLSLCKPENSVVDYAEFGKARKQAMVVFNFKE